MDKIQTNQLSKPKEFALKVLEGFDELARPEIQNSVISKLWDYIKGYAKKVILKKPDEELQIKLFKIHKTFKEHFDNIDMAIELKKEKSDDKITAMSNVLGINKMKAQIDELNQGQNSIIGKLSEVITGMNSITQAVNTNAHTTEPAAAGNPLEKIELISSLIDKLGPLYQIYKQTHEPAPLTPLIDQEFINKRMVESFLSELDTGKDIQTFVKTSLKRTATKNIINTALKDIGQNTDEPA